MFLVFQSNQTVTIAYPNTTQNVNLIYSLGPETATASVTYPGDCQPGTSTSSTIFDYRALHDLLHRAAYQHVYVHHDGGPDDEHLDYHYPAPWPYDHKQHDINDDNRPQQHQHDDEHERARRRHDDDHVDPDDQSDRADDHGCSDDDAGYAHDDDHKPVVLDHILAVIDKHEHDAP